MKNNKKITVIKRIALFLATFCIVTAIFAPYASAWNTDLFKEWTVSEDEMVLYGDGEPYYRVTYKNFYAVEFGGYVFYNEIRDEDGYYDYSVVSTEEHGEYVWTYDADVLYATKEGMRVFDKLKSFEDISEYRMYDMSGMQYALIDKDAAEHMRSNVKNKNATEIDFEVLGFRTRYDLSAVDAEGNLEYVYATVYLVEDNWYYLDRTTLPDSCYAEGTSDLNYKEGTATVYRLDLNSNQAIEGAIENLEFYYYQDAYINGKWIYESSMYNERFIEANRPGVTALILVIAAFVAFIVAILIPLPVYALGAILPQLKKLGKPKYWYSLCIFAAIWTALTVLLFLVVILAVLI